MNLNPSSAHLWSNCAAQPRLSKDLPKQQPSEYALEGRCATWLAELVLTGQATDCESMIGKAHKDGWVIDQAMAFYIQGYVDKIRSLGGEIHVEERLTFNQNVSGFADVFNVTPSSVIVTDLKYGYKIVEPFDAQPVIYGKSLADMYPDKSITMAIYQPRAFHPRGIYRDWTPTRQDLNQIAERFHRASFEATASHPQASPGEHCKSCPVNDRCGAMMREIYEVYTLMGGRAARPMSAQELSNEFEFIKRAEDMVVSHRKSLEAEMIARMDNGKNIPGWVREQSYGNRRWKHPRETIMLLTGGFDPAGGSMVTPAEAERQGLHPEIVKNLTETPKTKPRIKRIRKEDFARKFEQ
jgi:hypothetical protein